MAHRRPVVFGDIAFIPLTRGKVAVVDGPDLHLVAGRPWQATEGTSGSTWYAMSSPGNGVSGTLMHHAIVGAPGPGMDWDHIDRNGLNNRRSNLRLATRSQNNAIRPGHKDGTSRYKGVHWQKNRGKWQASIRVDDRRTHLGTFTDEADAAKAYDAAAQEAWGEFAYLNFPAGGR